MNKLNATIVVIDDEKDLKEANVGLFAELDMNFETVIVFMNQLEGIEYIQNNIGKQRMLVLLDLDFPAESTDGHDILNSIREFSFLVPVIIWSGIDEDKETFADLINNKAFAFLNKNESSENIISTLSDAFAFIDNDVSAALEDWITTHSEEDKDKPYMISVDGKKVTLNDMLQEIRMQSDIGVDFSKKVSKLTIDLLMRNKEKLDD